MTAWMSRPLVSTWPFMTRTTSNGSSGPRSGPPIATSRFSMTQKPAKIRP